MARLIEARSVAGAAGWRRDRLPARPVEGAIG
jgi:hypothetical protein